MEKRASLCKSCDTAAKTRRAETTCIGCGDKFMPRALAHAKYCSRDCAYRHQDQWSRRALPFTKLYACGCGALGPRQGKCARCRDNDAAVKVLFEIFMENLTGKHCRYCSVIIPRGERTKSHCRAPACVEASVSDRREAKRKSHRTARILYGHKWKEIARIRGVPYEPVDYRVVLERDAWTCQICGSPTPAELRGTHDQRAPEVDHIIPISRGGPHTYSNVQCACRQCNREKSNRLPHEANA